MECYQRLGHRILRTLGHPMINVEVHPDQLNEAISMSIDFFTTYCGYTREYLIFDSRLYDHNKGIRLDQLFTVANTDYTPSEILQNRKIGPDPDFVVDIPEQIYFSLSAIPYSYFSGSSSLSSAVPLEGITKMQLVNVATYAALTGYSSDLVELFQATPKQTFTVQCEPQEDVTSFNNMFDYDIMDYRKVIDVISFEESSNMGSNALFNVDGFLAQQSFGLYGLGTFGFDMLSWHMVKDYQDTRNKIFATQRDVHFDQRTQYLRLFPQPKNHHFYGILECYVERPIRDLVKEAFVLQYATAIVKVMWGRVLTKISGVNLIGGGTLNGGEILQEGVAEKERLENFLVEGGYGIDPIMMQVG